MLIRTIGIYLLLIIAMRLSGKRQIGELQLSELVTTFLISEIASYPLTNPAIPFLHAVVPIFTLICFEIILSFLATKSAFMKTILDGKPSVIIRRGQIDQKEMLKMRLSLEDLLCELRLKNIAAIADVEYAILEPNGQISVFAREDKREVTVADLHNKNEGIGIAHAIIIDGHFQEETMRDIGINQAKVLKILKTKKISNIKSVFLMTVDDGGSIYLIPKS